MLCLVLYFQGIEGSTAIGVTQVVTTSVGMTDIDIRAVSGSVGNQYLISHKKIYQYNLTVMHRVIIIGSQSQRGSCMYVYCVS